LTLASLLFIGSCAPAFAVKVENMTAETTPTADDVFYIVNDPLGTPAARKLTFANFEAALNHDSLAGFLANEHIDWTGASAGTIHSSNYVDNTDDTVSGSELEALISVNGLLQRTGLNTFSTLSTLAALNTALGSSIADGAHTTDTNTTYTAGGTILQLVGTVFSLKEGTLNDTKGCIFTTASGVVCNSDFAETAGRSLTKTGNTFDADSELYVFKAKIAFEDPTATDDFNSFDHTKHNVTITSIYCETDTGTVNLDVNIDDGTPAGINGSDIVCTSTGVEDAILAGDTSYLSGEKLDLAITSVATTPGYLTVIVQGTYDD